MSVEAQATFTSTTMEDEPADFESLFAHSKRKLPRETLERMYVFHPVSGQFIKLEQNAGTLPVKADFPEDDTDAQSAFDLLHEIEKQERQRILEEIRQLPLPISERVSARLQALIKNAEEEYPEEELLSVPSMWDVTKFLRSDHAWTYPDIVVSVRGNIVLDWLHDERHHLTIEFLGEGQTKLVLLAPDIVWKHRLSVVASTQSVESIPALLKTYDALSWVTQ